MYTNGVDIANRALQYVGATRISSFSDNSKQAAETAFTWPLIRQAELRRSVWRCAIKRAVLRPWTESNTHRFIPPAWTIGVDYPIGVIAQDTDGTYWISMSDHIGDTTNAPGVYIPGMPQNWQQWFGSVFGNPYSSTATYYAGELVTDGSNQWYISVRNGNADQGLPSNTSWWVPQPAATIITPHTFLPVGQNVTINGRARNMFPLPLYYLRITNQDPKVGSTATNTVSAGLRFNDWELEGNYLVSADDEPIIFRYVADIWDVTLLDPLLCEALAARLGYSICESLTQSNIKLQAIGMAYQKFMHDARMVNLIETGSTEPEEDTYLLSRGPAGVIDNVPSGGTQNAGSPETPGG